MSSRQAWKSSIKLRRFSIFKQYLMKNYILFHAFVYMYVYIFSLKLLDPAINAINSQNDSLIL